MAEHTALPWRFVPAHVAEGDAEVRHPDGWLICCTPSDELAKCIVAAANTQPAVADLVKALGIVRSIISEGALTGFNCHDGDWADRLYASQGMSSTALSRFRELEKGNG